MMHAPALRVTQIPCYQLNFTVLKLCSILSTASEDVIRVVSYGYIFYNA